MIVHILVPFETTQKEKEKFGLGTKNESTLFNTITILCYYFKFENNNKS